MMRYFSFFLAFALSLQIQAQDTLNIRALTYNIYHGATMKGDFNLDTIAGRMAHHQPDLVALQEVDRLTNRARHLDLVTELGYRTGLAPLFARAMYYDSGEYGEGILSRFSFIQTINIPLPHLPHHEPRAAAETYVELPSGDTLVFVGTHFEHTRNAPDRIDQARFLAERYRDFPHPVILAGDLNDVPESETLQALFEVFDLSDPKAAPTFSSDDPRKKIDYILTDKKHQWQVIQNEVIQDLVVSDHCGYFTELQLIIER